MGLKKYLFINCILVALAIFITAQLGYAFSAMVNLNQSTDGPGVVKAVEDTVKDEANKGEQKIDGIFSGELALDIIYPKLQTATTGAEIQYLADAFENSNTKGKLASLMVELQKMQEEKGIDVQDTIDKVLNQVGLHRVQTEKGETIQQIVTIPASVIAKIKNEEDMKSILNQLKGLKEEQVTVIVVGEDRAELFSARDNFYALTKQSLANLAWLKIEESLKGNDKAELESFFDTGNIKASTLGVLQQKTGNLELINSIGTGI